MMALFRLRRYRVLLACAFIVTVLLYHVAQNSSRWDSSPEQWHSKTHPHARPRPESPPPPPPHREHGHDGPGREHKPHGAAKPQKPKPDTPPPPPPPERPSDHGRPASKQEEKKKEEEEEPTIRLPKLKTSNGVKGGYSLPTRAPVPPKQDGAQEGSQEGERIHWVDPPARLQEDAVPTSTTIHWEKPSEWFPVPEESLILLPTGKPKPMPSVQFAFADKESPEAKEKREFRLAKVKSEAQRAWSGYKKYAWTHDEVMPVSLKAKDPFCGWAATMVDALDTLWIMGMKEEFDDAVEAVKEIDFTTTPFREDIPVFETIIRYLGGLLGAYDVAGGHDSKYRVLLDKAVELAEILMGVFDTPNRMPILYYNWKPVFNVNAKRASVSAGVAELGSMSMEFTRLAQLTGKAEYYDAVARITDALEDLQNRPNGTAIPGIFPEHIDASGCNRSAPLPSTLDRSSVAAQNQAGAAHADLTGDTTKAVPEGPANQISDKPNQGSAVSTVAESEPEEEAHSGLRKRDADGRPTSPPAPFTAQGLPADWECVPQGLTSGGWGAGSYSMGGSQDSAYEYFPKQYVLLGGLVDKYRAMHEKVADAVTKYLLFRPMAEGDPDVLFSAKAFAAHMNPESLNYQYEVTHLTCFLGGMYGLGGKLFGRPEDVEIGKKLTDGCVWAYEVMPTGIMPEYAMALPCESRDNCRWNQEAWYEKLDPMKAERRLELEQYEKRRAQWEREVEDVKAQEVLRKQAAEQKRQAQEEAEKERRKAQQAQGGSAEPKAKPDEADEDVRSTDGLRKRDPAAIDLQAATEDRFQKVQSSLDLDFDMAPQGASPPRKDSYSAVADEQELVLPLEPTKPITHEQFVMNKIQSEHLPAGFVSLNDKRYILRPEAIESVWYMYRITGDPSWQDKGWRMFEAVSRATRTDAAHSAIRDVTAAGAPVLEDSMESFWLAETLKYFYLLFAEPDVISLDEWVLNTEAHPFRRPT